jgi:hypothetical protein
MKGRGLAPSSSGGRKNGLYNLIQSNLMMLDLSIIITLSMNLVFRIESSGKIRENDELGAV